MLVEYSYPCVVCFCCAADRSLNCFPGNGPHKGKGQASAAILLPGSDSYDALTSLGEEAWDPGPGEFDIVYDSPIRDTMVRPQTAMTITTNPPLVSRKGGKGRQPIATLSETPDLTDEYEEYEVDRNPGAKRKKKSKLPRLPGRFSKKRQNSLQRQASKGRKELPPLPKKPSQGSIQSSGPEPIPRKPRVPPSQGRPPMHQPPPSLNIVGRRNSSRGSQPGITPPERPTKSKSTSGPVLAGKGNKEPRAAPRRKSSPPPPRVPPQPSGQMYMNNVNGNMTRRSGGPPPPPPPSRPRHTSISDGSASSGEVFLSQPKVIGKKMPGKKAFLPSGKGRTKR